MEIEKELKQTTFRNEYYKLSVNLIFSCNWLLEKIKLILEKEDITYQQYNILRILERSPSALSTLQIRERMLDRMSDTSRIVERLVLKNFVDKKPCHYDKRLVDVTLSEKGRELLERLNASLEALDAICSNLSKEEAVTLNGLLDKLRDKD